HEADDELVADEADRVIDPVRRDDAQAGPVLPGDQRGQHVAVGTDSGSELHEKAGQVGSRAQSPGQHRWFVDYRFHFPKPFESLSSGMPRASGSTAFVVTKTRRRWRRYCNDPDDRGASRPLVLRHRMVRIASVVRRARRSTDSRSM